MLAQVYPFFCGSKLSILLVASGDKEKMYFEAKFIILWLQFLQQYVILPNPTSFFHLKIY